MCVTTHSLSIPFLNWYACVHAEGENEMKIDSRQSRFVPLNKNI